MKLDIVNTLYPQFNSLSAAEMAEIAEAMNKPSVKRYLMNLGVQGLYAIATGIRDKDESAESYLQRQAVVQGQLATIETLLTIEAPAKQA